MLRLKEYQDWTIEEKLYMPDINGEAGIDILRDARYEFAKWTDQADIGISKNGVGVAGVPRKKTVLMLFEPPNQLPHAYQPRLHRLYGGLMCTVHLDGMQHFYIPRAFNNVGVFFGKEKTDLLCMIGRDMKSPMFQQYDLTAKRRELIAFFSEKLGKKDFHLYGRWNPGPCYLGEIGPTAHGLSGYNLSCPVTAGQTLCWDGKYEVLSRHKFTLALENSMWSGYYGCKMIEAMQCGSIPLYVGDPDIDNHTPRNVYIDMRGKSNEELLHTITSMTEEEINGYRERIYQYLHKQGNNIFSSCSFAKKLISVLRTI